MNKDDYFRVTFEMSGIFKVAAVEAKLGSSQVEHVIYLTNTIPIKVNELLDRLQREVYLLLERNDEYVNKFDLIAEIANLKSKKKYLALLVIIWILKK